MCVRGINFACFYDFLLNFGMKKRGGRFEKIVGFQINLFEGKSKDTEV